jgi:hypothetical protein
MRTQTRTGRRTPAREIVIADDDRARLETLLRLLAAGDLSQPGAGTALAGELRRRRSSRARNSRPTWSP